MNETDSIAWKRTLSRDFIETMRREGISRAEMAKRMAISRSELERFLDPEDPDVLIETVQKAATAIGKRLTIELIDPPASATRKSDEAQPRTIREILADLSSKGLEP